MGKIIISIITFGWFSLGLTHSYPQWRGYMDWEMPGPGMMDWGWWGMGWIFMIIFWGLVIVGMIFLIKWLAGLSRSRAPFNKDRDSALEILRQRYAKGEIDKEEFYQKKRDLM